MSHMQDQIHIEFLICRSEETFPKFFKRFNEKHRHISMSTSVIKSWADAEDDFPAPEVTTNPDGTKTVTSYRLNNKNQKVRIVQKIKEVKVQEKVHPLIAARKNWHKYGKEKNTPPGPDTRTTQLGEKVELNLGTSWKEVEKQEVEAKEEESKLTSSNQRIKCRLCGGDHFTSKCPFKETLGADASGANSAEAEAAEPENTNGKYVPRHMRRDANGNLPKDVGGRDDLTTLRVAQLNTIVNEDMLREELLARYGPLQRVTVVRDRETGESRGFAYVAFATESLAEQALNDLNGKGYHSLILHLEWSKKKK